MEIFRIRLILIEVFPTDQYIQFRNDLQDVLFDCRVHMYVLVRRILILVYTQLTVIFIELTVRIRQMDYALSPHSPNILCFREPMFLLLYLDWVSRVIKLTLSSLKPIWVLYLMSNYRGLTTYISIVVGCIYSMLW